MRSDQALFLLKADQSIRNAIARIGPAPTLRDVLTITRGISIAPHLRSLMRSQPAYRALRYAAETRLKQLIEVQLEAARKLPFEACKTALATLQRTEWEQLRGEYAGMFHFALMSAREICQVRARSGSDSSPAI